MVYVSLLVRDSTGGQNGIDVSCLACRSAMEPASRLPERENDLPREFVDLARQIAALPPAYQATLEVAFSRVVDSAQRRRRVLSLVQEALAQLRLDIKYLMFDLDVTKRERDELRERLGGR